MKKEISILTGMLLDLGEDSRPKVKEVHDDLRCHDERLRALAKRPMGFM